jgi:hypothetical protein
MAVPIFGQTVTVTLVGAGDTANCTHNNDEATAQLLGSTLRNLTPDGTLPPLSRARVISLGDNAYTIGTRAQYANCYDNYRLSDGTRYDSSRSAWWGQYKNRTMPILGNHEYLNSSDSTLKSTPYFDYFSANKAVGFKDPPAPVPNTTANPGLSLGKGYYSYDLGSWHIVALNSNDHCAYVSCSGTSTQGKWLRHDLAANPSACTLAYIHHPLYATGSGGVAPEVKPLIKILYNNNADVVLNAHNHRYERLARIDPNGNPDRARGSEVRIFNTPGVIRIDLSSGSYSWKFVAVDGTPSGKVMDSTPTGKESCH